MSKVKLSKRLEVVASSVGSGGTVADIGCDHGFTSIYLTENKRAKCGIAMDINKGPLEKAKIHIEQAGLKDKMDKMILRNIYTESKTAESVEERENARRNYLDRKEIPEVFRW